MSFEDFLRENKASNGFKLHTWVLPDRVKFFIQTEEGNTLKFEAIEDKVVEDT